MRALTRSSCVPVALLFCLLAAANPAASAKQKPLKQQQQQSSGITWAMQAMTALTGGNPVSSVTESGSVTRSVGGDPQSGQLTLQSSGTMTSQLSVSIADGTLTETRTWQDGNPAGVWVGFDGTRHDMAEHNCWTDAVWFFPALSLLADYADPNLVFSDLGQEQYSGGSVEHIRVYRTASGLSPDDLRLLARLSAVDYYLDTQTSLPVALSFPTHADGDLNVNLPIMVVFTDYRTVNGIRVPFRVTKSLNGTPIFQISLSSALPNG